MTVTFIHSYRRSGKKMTLKKLNVHACVHVHGRNWMRKSCMVEVRGILQKKFKSWSIGVVEKRLARQQPFTQLWRVSAETVVVKSALPNPPQTPKCPNALVSERKGGSAVLKEVLVAAFMAGVLIELNSKSKCFQLSLLQKIFSPCLFIFPWSRNFKVTLTTLATNTKPLLRPDLFFY